jgi:hypothetical protein
VLGHGDKAVVGLLDGEPFLLDLVMSRVRGVRTGEVTDGSLEGGGEEHRLAFRGETSDDLVDLRLEPHVEHAVGLVQHQDRDPVERHQTAVD